MMSDERIQALEQRVAQLTALLGGTQTQRMPMVAGTFTPPADLLPAVMDLDPVAFEYLQQLTAGRAVTPSDLVAAADWFESTRRVAA